MAARKGLEVFVSRLPWTIGIQELRSYFTQFGPVRNCRIAFDDSTGFSKGFGFVSFGNTSGMQSALKREQHLLDGHKVNVQAKQSTSPAVKKLQISEVMENGH
ncbi:SRA stem-loop-interacting RNA-binding protein, mitochondrial-like [Strongylocentrotus purpuratus]|uniref:RRM domain-containing protein n=1 Tax=Strongylocentrotus purpuratus TaxID=7668 RepID=A0A7M7T4Y9_STRPU|nr:SRA stem-loop-interacting RNA-binding protein, mitochondrial-like [Strongylocentrotus purpuratus]|eukprot:XP_001184908.1 PREDICTED: SRA stem-loop-interacting RNA-binding protein, mitochondrial-like [Strongylocentrotus purpuratus]